MQTGNTNIAYPFLDAIGASLVEGFVVSDIIVNLLIIEYLKSNVCRDVESMLLSRCQQTYPRRDLMRLPTEQTKHTYGVSLIHRFAEDFVTHDNNSIRCNHEFIVPHRLLIGICLFLCNIACHLADGQICRE